MNALTLLQRHLCLSSRKLVERHLGHAKKLLLSNEPADIYCALNLLDTALKLSPHSEKAIELKARALLCLRRFQDVANLLHEFIPSLKAETLGSGRFFDTEKVKLLEGQPAEYRTEVVSNVRCFSLFPSKGKLWVTFSRKGEREQFRYVVLGQACCHLGMMQDAMVLLSNGKRAASAAVRKHGTSMREDDFILDSMFGPDSDVVNHLLHSIKYLLRRRAAALAAVEAGLYLEAARHLSKIIDGRRGTPQAFISECCLYQATAYHAANRLVDAIADCNRCLALNPMCAEAIDIRATIYETIGCFDDCLGDLDQLRALYVSGFQNHKSMWFYRPSIVDIDVQGSIDIVNSRLAAVRERWSIHDTTDHHRILGVSRGCSRAEAERALVVLSLKHRPDKAAHFIDQCEFVDDRKIEDVKGQARLMGSNLFQLIEKSYTGVLALVMEEEMRREMRGNINDLALCKAASIMSFWVDTRDIL
ncbi:hypothetical protein GOP47_0019219 [Adiantum capillus-veneris]|uniref:Uncharacterized protein n=1 Tax=Adiantum capillus-veneris TaxID=13818 RepID=A0A9D4ZAG0_ADICA|nr:hypothetical protein GOP47_0019219 [Adiantum capillus-veneris]